MSDELCGCFPAHEDLAAFAERALTGERGVPFVGDGSPDTVISCGHGEWRLGDVLTYEAEQDQEPGQDDGEPKCSEPGCEKPPAKGRKWCSTHASPKNRKGGGDVQEGQQTGQKVDGGEGRP